MWPYPWTHVGTPSHLGHMDRVAATMPSKAHAGAAQEAPDIGQWEGQDVPLVRPSSCNVKGGIPSSRRYLPTYLSTPSTPCTPSPPPTCTISSPSSCVTAAGATAHASGAAACASGSPVVVSGADAPYPSGAGATALSSALAVSGCRAARSVCRAAAASSGFGLLVKLAVFLSTFTVPPMILAAVFSEN